MACIYIAEDDSDIRHIVGFCLEDEGHEVHALKDGEALWEKLVSRPPPDLLVLDLMMPGMDGFEVLEAMTSWGIRDSTRVLVVTARTSEADQSKVLALGADRVLTKPFDPDELVRTVEQLLALSPTALKLERTGGKDTSELLSQLETLLGDS